MRKCYLSFNTLITPVLISLQQTAAMKAVTGPSRYKGSEGTGQGLLIVHANTLWIINKPLWSGSAFIIRNVCGTLGNRSWALKIHSSGELQGADQYTVVLVLAQGSRILFFYVFLCTRNDKWINVECTVCVPHTFHMRAATVGKYAVQENLSCISTQMTSSKRTFAFLSIIIKWMISAAAPPLQHTLFCSYAKHITCPLRNIHCK